MRKGGIKLSVYICDYFPEGSRPSRATVIRWAKSGIVDGEQIGKPGENGKRGGPWFIFPDGKPEENQPYSDLIAEFEQEAVPYGYGQTTHH